MELRPRPLTTRYQRDILYHVHRMSLSFPSLTYTHEFLEEGIMLELMGWGARCVVSYTKEVGHVLWIRSTRGHHTGSFLLHLQLLIAFLCGIRKVTLENVTDDPVRATRGIYRLFRVIGVGSMAERLRQNDGKMYLRMGGWVKRAVERAMFTMFQRHPLFWSPHMIRCLEDMMRRL